MFDSTNLSSQALFSTLRIVGLKSGNRSYGTGFFFQFFVDDDKVAPFLVTNAHVVDGCENGDVLLHAKRENSESHKQFFSLHIEDFEAAWHRHPTGEDLCIMSAVPMFRVAEEKGFTILWKAFSENDLPTQEVMDKLSVVEPVTMVGYPLGLADDVNNYPLMRRGVTSYHPSLDFRGQPRGVVDIAAFPGSSGSPILILDEGMFIQGGGLVSGSRLHLLGILASGPQHLADGTVEVRDVPTNRQDVFTSTQIPIHLGYYLKSRLLLDFKPRVLAMSRPATRA